MVVFQNALKMLNSLNARVCGISVNRSICNSRVCCKRERTNEHWFLEKISFFFRQNQVGDFPEAKNINKSARGGSKPATQMQQARRER
jgi:hypothetical protein